MKAISVPGYRKGADGRPEIDPDKEYVATIYSDTPETDYLTNPQSYAIRQVRCTSRSTLVQDAAEAGGYAISFREAGPQDRKIRRL